MTKIDLKDIRIRYDGRIDKTDPDTPIFTWPGCLMEFSFVGTCLELRLTKTWGWGERKVGVVLDGKELSFDIENGENVITVAKGLENTRHTAVIYKMSEGHYFVVNEVLIDGELCEGDPSPKRRIEVYGDSVSAGSVVDCIEYEGKQDPEDHNGRYDNALHAYPLLIARNMPARVYVTSQGGISIFDGTGWFEHPNTTGMESCWDKACYCTNVPQTEWDFSFKPHVIVFAIGQNDSNPDPDCLRKPEYYKKWTDKYVEIVNGVKAHAPKAKVIFALTVLMHDPIWDDALCDIKNRLGGEEKGFYHFTYSRCGKATPGHPRINEQIEMANELTEFMNSLPADTWEN